MIPISSVRLDEEIENEVLGVLRSGMIAQGPKVLEFENLFAEAIGVKHAIAVNNGTTALVAAMRMLHLPEGSEVVTSPFTFVATLNAALEAGLTVRFADIDEGTFNVTDESLIEASTDRTTCVIPVHLYGQSAPMDKIMVAAELRNWKIVEDAAQAHGATHNGRAVGTYGVGTFSFYATKNLTTGEGGLVTTNDDEVADRIRIYRNQGMRQRYQYEMPGTNYRLTDVQAAIGIPQIRRMHEITLQRQHNAGYLSEHLSTNPAITIPKIADGNSHVWHQYSILINDELRRDSVLEELNQRGIGAGVYYPKLVHDYGCYADNPQVVVTETPIALNVTKRVLSLPVHQYLSTNDLDKIIESVNEATRML